jgi:hypothetical protein
MKSALASRHDQAAHRGHARWNAHALRAVVRLLLTPKASPLEPTFQVFAPTPSPLMFTVLPAGPDAVLRSSVPPETSIAAWLEPVIA